MTAHGLDHLDAESRRRWAAARVWSARQAPYLASALLALDPIVVDQSDVSPDRRLDLRALPVDAQWHLYLDPDVVESAEVPELGFWLVHQVSHLLRHHAARSPMVDPGGPATTAAGPNRVRTAAERAWNLAGDAEIDDDLAAGELTVPADAVTPHAVGLPDGLTAEQYWDLLRPGTQPTGEVAGPPTGGDGGSQANQRTEVDCGSGCDGRSRPWDSHAPGLGDTARRLVERDVAHQIVEHQRRRGDVPAGWQRWAQDALEPTVSWRRLLASAVRRGLADVAGRVDFTYRKPSRRSSALPDVIMPSLRQPQPKVAMVLDTSGSMNDRMLSQCLGEVGGILRSLGVARQSLRVVCCDAQAYEAQRVLKAGDVQLLGGGGTDMGVGLTRAAELKPRPDLVVVLTDGFTPWPSQAPAGIRVVVGLLDRAGSVPEWAHAVVVGDAPT